MNWFIKSLCFQLFFVSLPCFEQFCFLPKLPCFVIASTFGCVAIFLSGNHQVDVSLMKRSPRRAIALLGMTHCGNLFLVISPSVIASTFGCVAIFLSENYHHHHCHKSFHPGFKDSINSSFLLRDQLLICFSRSIAWRISVNSSIYTTLCVLYFAENPPKS